MSSTSGIIFLSSIIIFLLQPLPGRCSTFSGDEGNNLVQTIMNKLESAWNEALNVSPLAAVLIMLPVTLCFLLCICCICCCVKCGKKSKKDVRERTGSNSSPRLPLKSPPGEPSPIPLIGISGLANGSQNTFQLRPVAGQGPPGWTTTAA